MAKLSPFLSDYESILDQFTLTRANGDSLATDVYEQNGNVVIEAHIAGLDPEHVDISVEGNQLFIEGHREETDEQEDRDYYVKEVRYGSFERVVPLPAEVNLNKAEADYQNGILTITLPKVNGNSRKKIDVKAEKSTGKKASTKAKKSASKSATNKNNNKATSTAKKATSKNNNSKSASKIKSAKGSLSNNKLAKRSVSKNNNKSAASAKITKSASKSVNKNNNKATSTAKKATNKNNNSKSTSKAKSAKGSLSRNNNKKIAKKA